jgi:antitoxin CptB
VNEARMPLNPEVERRIHWRCRRGLLELDIVLGRFVERHYHKLDEAQRAAFDGLLDMPDTQLWDMITGGESSIQRQREFETVLEMLREA